MRRLGFVQKGEVSFEMTMTDPGGMETFSAVQTKREIRLTLGPGEAWPSFVRRGQSVDLEMGMAGDIWRLRGRVRFKRLRVAVIEGQLERAA